MNPLTLLIAIHLIITPSAAQSELLRGYETTPDTTTTTNFQPLLVDPTGNFSLSFLRIKPHHLTLAVVHLPSGDPLWTAALNRPATWSSQTTFAFNGSIVISDPHSGVFWSTNTPSGDRVTLSPTSNLQIIGPGSGPTIWQSFDFPSDTLLENQSFTSNMTLRSLNQLFDLRLGPDFIGLYAKFNENKDQIYYKHTAIEARAKIIPGQGPIQIRVSSDGYLAMYQKGPKPVDIQPFNSYERSVPGIRRIRIEHNGNLKGYCWSGSEWVSDYQAISETCELPSPCGLYGLCRARGGCTCLDTRNEARPGECFWGGVDGDLGGGGIGNGYTVLRRAGVELPFKERMGFVVTTSFEDCEGACESNCTCWGVVYNNASGYCYPLDYPIHTMVEIGDQSRVGYFKVRASARNEEPRVESAVVIGLLLLIGVIVAVGFGGYGVWRRKRRERGCLENDGFGTTYKYLELDSFRSIELSNRSVNS